MQALRRTLAKRLRRVLVVEPGEGALVAWSAATLFLVESASVAVSNVSDTLFLKRVGVDYLPIIFLVNSLLLTATTFAIGWMSVRFEPRRLLTMAFALLAVLLVVLWVLVLTSAPGIATTLIVLSKQIDVIALLLFWTIVGGLLSSRQSKRLVALMTAGGTLGTIAGSFASGPLGEAVGISSLLALAAAIFAVAALVSVPLGRSAPLRLYRSGTRSLPEKPPKLRTFWRQNSLFRVLVGTSFLAGVLGPMLYFEFSRAADLATQTADGEQQLLALYGMLRGWINVGVLVVQVGVSASLFRLIGVPLASALAPVAYLLGFGGLAVRFSLATAMPATMSTSVLDHTVYEPALRILGNLLPQRERRAANSFIQGPAKRAGAALGSVLILAAVGLGDPSLVALLGLPIAGLWVLLAVNLWWNYPNLLLETARVKGGDADDAEPVVAFLDGVTLRTLRQNLEGDDAGLCRASCDLFVDAPRRIAVEMLASAIPRAPAANRVYLVSTLDRVLADPAATASVGPVFADALVPALKTAEDLGDVERARLVQVLGRTSLGKVLPGAVHLLLEAVASDPSELVRTAARTACARRAEDAAPGAVQGDTVESLVALALGSSDPEVRSLAVSELRFELLRGATDSERRDRLLSLLVGRLDTQGAPDNGLSDQGLAEQRTEITQLLADVALEHPEAVQSFAATVLPLVDDESPALRSAVLRFLGNAGLEEHAGLLAGRLSSNHEEEAVAARRALERLGPRAAEALLHALHHGGRRAREVVPGLLRDLRADPAVLREQIEREIDASRELLVLLGVLDASTTSRLVLQRLRERVDESMHSALELLAVLLDDDRIAKVSRSLGRASQGRDRAVLLEALETLLAPEYGERILPLLEDQDVRRMASDAARRLGRPWPTVEEAMGQLLGCRDTLSIALLVATADRSALASVAPSLDADEVLRLFSEGADHVVTDRGGEAIAGVHDDQAAREFTMLSPVEKMLHLKALDLFEGLTTRELSELARVVQEVTMDDGKSIVREGEFEDSMYFIVRGAVRIERGGHLVAELGPRDFFGEMAVFDGETRSATVTAVGRLELLRLSRNDLFEVMEDQPAIGIGICQILVRRLRNLLQERPGGAGPAFPEGG